MEKILYDINRFFEEIFGESKVNPDGNADVKYYKGVFYRLFFGENQKTNVLSFKRFPRYCGKNKTLPENFEKIAIDNNGGLVLQPRWTPEIKNCNLKKFAERYYETVKKIDNNIRYGINEGYLDGLYLYNGKRNTFHGLRINGTNEIETLFRVVVAVSYIHAQEGKGNLIKCFEYAPDSPKVFCHSYFESGYKNTGRYGGYTDVKNSTGIFDNDKFEFDLIPDISQANINVNDPKKRYTLIDIIKENRNSVGISLTAAGGAGKTFIILKTIEEILRDDEFLPIYIPLNVFATAQEQSDSYENIFINFLIKRAFCKDIDGFLKENSRKVILFLDGFNEVNNVNVRIRLLHELKALLMSYNGLQFVLSSRIDHSNEFDMLGSGNIKHCVSCHICPLSEAVILEQAEKRNINLNYQALSQRQKSFLENAMGLKLFFEVVKAGDSVDNIANLGELLNKYLQIILALKPDNYDKELGEIAYKFVEKEKFVLEKGNFEFVPDVEILSSDKYGIDEKIEFTHQNFRDFYCAKYLKDKIKSIKSADSKEHLFKELIIFNERNKPFLNDEILQFVSDITEIDDIQGALTNISEMTHKEQAFYSVAIFNLIKIASMKSDNKSIASLNLSGLNLESVNLNSFKLYSSESDNEAEKFADAYYTEKTFLQPGHSLACRASCCLGDIIVTMSNLNVFCCNYKKDLWEKIPFKIVLEDSREIDPEFYTGKIETIKMCVSVDRNKIIAGTLDGSIFLMTLEFTDSEDCMPTSCVSRFIYKHKSRLGKIVSIGNNQFAASFSDGEIHKIKVDGDSAECAEKIQVDCNKNAAVSLAAFGNAIYISCGLDLYVCEQDNLASIRRISTLSDKNLPGEIYPEGLRIVDMCYVDGYLLLNLTNVYSESKNYNFEENETHGLGISVFCLISTAKKVIGKVKAFSECKQHGNRFFGFTQMNAYKNKVFCGVDGDNGIPVSDFYEIEILKDRGTVTLTVSNANSANMQKLTTYSALPLNDELVATCSRDRSFQLTKIGREETLPIRFDGSHDGICDIAIYKRNEIKYILASSYDGCISRFYYDEDEDDWRCCNVYNIHSDWVWRIANDGKYVYSASYDGTVRKTDLETEESELLLNIGEETPFVSVALCGDAVYAVSCDKLCWYDGNADDKNYRTGEFDLSPYGKARLVYSYGNNIYIVINDKKNDKDTATVYLLSGGNFKPIVSVPTYIKTMKIISANGNVICALGGYGYLGIITGFDKLAFSVKQFSTDEPEIMTAEHKSVKYIPVDVGGKVVNYLDIRCDSCDNEETLLQIAACCKEKNVFSRSVYVPVNGDIKIDSLFEDGTGDTHVAQPLCLMFDPYEEDEFESVSSRDFYVGLLDGKIYRYPDNEQVINVVPGLLANDKVDVRLDYEGMKNYFKR